MYGFVENSPLKNFDLLGLFETSREALTTACKTYGPISFRTQLEYGGVIMKCEDKKDNVEYYDYTAGQGERNSVSEPVMEGRWYD